MPSVASLGHLVSKERLLVDPQEIEANKNWVWPKSMTEVRSFMGLASYYCTFVKNIASVATHLTSKRDLNLRQKRWMKLLENYDVTIQYHPRKTNVVTDMLSRKMINMGSLACLGFQHLAREIQALESKFMWLCIAEKGGVLAWIEFKPTF
ncbi:hypothetical protein MTR67_040085 [Solanum verrucosum]|uniref:Uncharacterized protein n=1 Tax=Solanum verrucosum TaxID=315347 RepID=A0AAF0ZRC5_SOLVR|nr:hypothetical protein MTR67_040085 [Solanum verrucosum]